MVALELVDPQRLPTTSSLLESLERTARIPTYLQLVEVLPPELLSGLSGLSEQSSLVRPEGLVRDELVEVLVLLLRGVLRRVPDHAVLHDVPRLALARRLVRGGAGGAAAVAVDGVLRRDDLVLEVVVEVSLVRTDGGPVEVGVQLSATISLPS